MLRMILGIVVGVVTCALLVIVGGWIIRESWPEYAAVERAMTFTESMLVTRLALSTIALLIAAWVTTLIVRKSVAALILGIVLLLISIPIHINLRDKFPVWYHLTFLVTLIPLSILGGRIGGNAGRVEQADAKTS
jgi:hypothetical protein